jgi:hypothetical protein
MTLTTESPPEITGRGVSSAGFGAGLDAEPVQVGPHVVENHGRVFGGDNAITILGRAV